MVHHSFSKVAGLVISATFFGAVAQAQNIEADSQNLGIQLLSDEEIQQRLPNPEQYPQDPKRIAAMEFSFVGDLLAVDKKPAAVSDDGKREKLIPEYRDALGEYISLGSRYQPSLEVISDVHPDLIIGDSERHNIIKDDLEKIAPTLLIKSHGENYQENLQAAQLVGYAVHRPDAMQSAIGTHLQHMVKAKEAIQHQDIADDTMQFAVITDKGMWMHGPTSYAGSVLAALGIKSPIPDQTEKAYIPTSLEQLVAADPDWLLLGRYTDKTVFDDWQSSPLYQNLTAVKNGHVIEVEAPYWSLSRSMTSAERIADDVLAASQQ